MGTLQIKTTAGIAMMNALDDEIGASGGWALFTTGNDTDVDSFPSGTLLKHGALGNPAFGPAGVSGTGASEVARITLQTEGAQVHADTGTAAVLALFKDYVDASDIVVAQMVLKGDVATSNAWCTMANTTITTADVDLDEGNCTIDLNLTHTV